MAEVRRVGRMRKERGLGRGESGASGEQQAVQVPALRGRCQWWYNWTEQHPQAALHHPSDGYTYILSACHKAQPVPTPDPGVLALGMPPRTVYTMRCSQGHETAIQIDEALTATQAL